MGGGNAAVQAVGRTFFRVTIVGYVLSALAMFPAVILGIRGYYFEYEIDRCSCVVPISTATSSATGSPILNEVCVYGNDFVKVDIGWKKYTLDQMVHTYGCPIAVQTFTNNPGALDENLDKPKSFLAFNKVYSISGPFQKTDFPLQADESNGGAECGGGIVAMQVVCALFAIFTYKMLKASYLTNGSHCSIGLGLMTRLNFMVGAGLATSLVCFWWLIEGRFGDPDQALTQALEDTFFNECWMETTSQEHCPIRPWELKGPGWAYVCGIFQVGMFMLMTLYMFWRAPTVEGVLDGSMDPTGVMLKPRVVEVEMVVGKALATDGDPDYDSENPLYNGAATMIRPYPLPKSAKASQNAEAVVMDVPDADGVAPPGGSSSTASSEYELKSDPEMADDQISALHSDFVGGPADLEMIEEESEEDRTSSRYSETRYSEASRYSDTYSDYGDRPARASRVLAAPMR